MGRKFSGQLNAALKVPDVVGSIIEQNIAAAVHRDQSPRVIGCGAAALNRGYLIAMYAQFEPDAF